MQVHLIGTGAVGSLYGGLLARARARLTVQCRSDFIEVQRDGIRIESLESAPIAPPSASVPRLARSWAV
jgi:ketopantoate reductase